MNKVYKSRSKFNLSHEHKFTSDMGNLIPILCEDVYPGDTFRAKTDAVVRFAPMLAPLMHQVDVYTHYFFCPNRKYWKNSDQIDVENGWENFITGGETGEDTSVPPYINSGTGFEKYSLPDYLGLPINVPNINVNALPFRAFADILNEWYRNEVIQTAKIPISQDGGEAGPDSTTSIQLFNRNWNKDYFTRCAPTQQKGPSVALPLSGNANVTGLAPVSGIGALSTNNFGSLSSYKETDATAAKTVTGWSASNTGSASNHISGLGIAEDSSNPGYPNIRTNADASTSTLTADLSNVSSATVADLRLAFQLQKWLEANMRGGSRYIESILQHFGVRSADARLQRPEFLGGGRSPVVFSEVLQTSDTTDATPQGNMSGHGFSAHKAHQFTKSFTEHGWIFGIMSVMPKSSYASQGIDRRFWRPTRFDYVWPLFAHLSEMRVLNQELVAQSESVVDSEGNPVNKNTFGFLPQFDSERYRLNRVSGDFRDDLDYWTLVRKFFDEDTGDPILPALNSTFINCVPSKRIFAEIASDSKLRTHVYHHLTAIRVLPKYGNPGGI